MGKGINIKVSKDKLLGALQDKLSVIQNTQAEYEYQVKAYEVAQKDYLEQVKKITISNPDLITSVVHFWRGDGNTFELQVQIPNSQMPVKPEEPKKPYSGGRGYGRNYVSNDYDDMVADLTNAIRMLKLSDEDVVSTATYASVSRYL